MITVAVSYAAVASAMPIEGGTYFYPSRVLTPFWGFLGGWARWLAYITPLALTAFVFSDHIQTVAPGLPAPLLMVCFIGFFNVLNVLGIKISSTAQTIIFCLLVAGFLVFIGAGLPKVNTANLSPVTPFGFVERSRLLRCSSSPTSASTRRRRSARRSSTLPATCRSASSWAFSCASHCTF
jgi:APA family basic amino acid/polyamine antiporter